MYVHTYKDLCLNAPSRFTGNSPNWKQPKCPLTGEWISKLQYIPTMELWSTIQRSELWIHTTGTNFNILC